MALLQNHVGDTAIVKPRYKTYAFAAPMFGNVAFVNEFNQRYCETSFSFNIVNPADPVPKFPVSVVDKDSITLTNYVNSSKPNKKTISLKLLISEFVKIQMKDFVSFDNQVMKEYIKKEITKSSAPM